MSFPFHITLLEGGSDICCREQVVTIFST